MFPLSSIFFFIFIVELDNKVQCTTFTFVSKCGTTIWPGSLTNAGNPPLNPTGFELQPGQARSVQAPSGWSGRFWARTGCDFDPSGHGSCATGDCGSNQIECYGSGANPPATLAEFALAGPTSVKDFYDVSLVDGYNLPMMVEPGRGGCGSTGCMADLNQRCPAELRVGDGQACRSACDAFGKPEYCCSGAYADPSTCRPTLYSEIFKSACPRSYSYAFDDATSTFTCSGGDYTITFCPVSTASKKSSRPDPPKNQRSNTTTTARGGVIWGDDSWLASMDSADAPATTITRPFIQQVPLFLFPTLACILLIL